MSGSHIDTLAAPAIPPSSPEKYKRVLPWLVAVAFFMESLDTTILNTAIPTICFPRFLNSPGSTGNEICIGEELHVESRRFHSDQRLGGGSGLVHVAYSLRRSVYSHSVLCCAACRATSVCW